MSKIKKSKYCCVFQCKNHNTNGKALHFHMFPKSVSRRNEWIKRLKIGKLSSKYSLVCSDHFIKSDYFTCDNGYGNKELLKNDSVPTENIPTIDVGDAEALSENVPDSETDSDVEAVSESIARTTCDVDVSTEELAEQLVSENYVFATEEAEEEVEFENCVFATTDVELIEMTPVNLREIYLNCEIQNQFSDVDIQTKTGETDVTLTDTSDQLNQKVDNLRPATSEKSVMAKPETKHVGIQVQLPRKRTSFDSLTNDDLIYFTGLERERFNILFNMLEKFNPIEDNMFWCKRDALVITLYKCKHNIDFKMMEFTFELDRKFISQMFKEVIEKLYVVLRKIDIWKLSPKDPSSYRCILDCTEIYVVRANDPSMHQLTFSTYKNHPTFKLLVSCNEKGAVNFISEAFVGSTSDREILIKSGLIEKLEKGDAILADKGFDVSDLFEEKGVLVNIPPFLRGKKQLSDYEVMKTRTIANRRIVIENVNCRAKKNKILTSPMQKCLWPYADKMIYVCFALVNFYKPLK